MKTIKPAPAALEIFILAGGLSSRMGRYKSRLRIGRKTMLRHVRDAASQLGFPVRIIERDAVPRCGPLGGIATALKHARAQTILLLACDMPFVSAELLRRMISALRNSPALFASENGRAGFPILLRSENSLSIIMEQIADGELSLQSLAKTLRAKKFNPPRKLAGQLKNINTPEDLRSAQSILPLIEGCE